MIKTIIIEDEINARSVLKKMIQLINPEIHIIGETGYVHDAIKLIENHKPQLIFLDIQLEDGTGFDLLRSFEKPAFHIIFTTAYNEYALNAFKFSATDYLLKPINPLQLETAIDKVSDRIHQETNYNHLLNVLKHNMDDDDKKIVLKTTDHHHVVSLKNIIRCEADTAYTKFICADENIIISKNIKFYQEVLGTHFIRCHQSHLVNKDHIKSILKKTMLLMSNGDEIPISTRKRTSVIAAINK